MKHKRVMISGFAFGENGDMKKLKKLAQKGWILHELTPLFYKFKKGEPQNIDYSLDYQSDYDEEYFRIFREAGWTHRATLANEMHIFSALEGTNPIYRSGVEQSEPYVPMIKQTAKVSAIAFLVMIAFEVPSLLWIVPGWLSTGLTVLQILALVAFIFTFMPFLGFLVRRIRMVQQG